MRRQITLQIVCMNFQVVLFADNFRECATLNSVYEKIFKLHTPNANMVDHSVVAQNELHESEVSEASMICFENASPENSCLVLDLFCFISLCERVAVFLNATRRDRNLPPFTSMGK